MKVTWKEKAGVAMYDDANWESEVTRKSFGSLDEAKAFGAADDNVTFFFYMTAPMVLDHHGTFNPGDAVFFGGKPWYGSAPQANSYEKKPDPLLPLSAKEQALVNTFNTDPKYTHDSLLAELKTSLQTAVEIELATIPIYLFTYYSINRLPSTFPTDDLSRYADKAGALTMSVVTEEMLHMSLSSNVLYAVGGDPQLYLKSPKAYPTNLPGHEKLGPDKKPLAIPLSKFSEAQLWQFLAIEYPAEADAPPEDANWDTIGQIYSYVRCIISCDKLTDADFQGGSSTYQIQPYNYSPNHIDTVYPHASFNYKEPVPDPVAGSAATVARFANAADSHAGPSELIVIRTKRDAMEAIATIDYQGEGFNSKKVDDPSRREKSHYYKFLKLQTALEGYPQYDKLPKEPPPPPPPPKQISPADLAKITYNFPDNPVAANYQAGDSDLANLCSALYQYMLILSETIFKVPDPEQKLFFNKALHMSMIWILDKVIRSMRELTYGTANPPQNLAPTFENYSLGYRSNAYATMTALADDFVSTYGSNARYSDPIYYIQMFKELPDVSKYWPDPSKYAGLPKFPTTPPATATGPRHACMGLNQCRGQGRTGDNACAGQGYCSTAIDYKSQISDHTCHVKNGCQGQGGCGLYGTAEEQSVPGQNSCMMLGSCATPINAERFSTDGINTGKSVWLRAREVFKVQVWPKLRQQNPSLPAAPPAVPGSSSHPDVFQYGPTIEWIQDYSGEGMTACGASGMSGAGSCA